MILLGKNKYHYLFEPVKAVGINNLFVRAVLEDRVSGLVYADDAGNPKTFYIVHPYGMSLLFGDCKNFAFNKIFKEYALNKAHMRNRHEWMQAYPFAWDAVLNDLFSDCMMSSADNIGNIENIIEFNIRVNFKFNRNKYNFRGMDIVNENIKIVRTDKKIFEDMKGSVVPYYFWNNADDFINNGIGFSLFYGSRLASTAYSSFIHDDKLEFGIETIDEFRGMGLAHLACVALINYCLKNNYEPVWACRLENTGSYRLAQKLGFEPVAKIPYYRLCK